MIRRIVLAVALTALVLLVFAGVGNKLNPPHHTPVRIGTPACVVRTVSGVEPCPTN